MNNTEKIKQHENTRTFLQSPLPSQNKTKLKLDIKSDYDNIYLPYCSWMKDCYDMLKKYNVNIKWPLKPTSGIRMLVYLLNNNDNISITGFDGGKGGHWYSTEDIFPTLKLGTRDMHVITQTINRKGKGFYKNKQVKHFLNEEFKFIKKLESEGRITII